jgi:hypothetical protein
MVKIATALLSVLAAVLFGAVVVGAIDPPAAPSAIDPPQP